MSRQMPSIFPIVILLHAVSLISGHGYLKTPRSRNLHAYLERDWKDGDGDSPFPEDCPHCLNRGGTRSQCGLLEGIDWNQDPWIRNYDAPLSLSGDRMPPVIQEIYTEGDVIEVEVMVTTHHKGHFVFSACPLVPLSDDPSHAREEWSPLRIPSAECFAAHPLKFVSDELYGAKPDPNHPERAYIAPAQIPTWGPGEGPNGQDGVVGALYKMQLELPKGLNGEVVLIRWYYLTANSCKHDGYSDYDFPTSWGSDVNNYKQMEDCVKVPSDGDGVPEQFWNCGEVKIERSTNKSPSFNKKWYRDNADTGKVEQDAEVVPETYLPATSSTTVNTYRCGTDCPPGESGFFPTVDCEGYYECRDGVLTGYANICHSGLIFNAKHQGCDWETSTECICKSDMIPYTPAQSSNKPIKDPIYSKPTKKPVNSQPTQINSNSNQIQQQSSSANTPDQIGSDYYPDYDKVTCLNDGQAPDIETNFYSTHDTCCKFSSMDTQTCQQNNPKIEKWYPTSDSFCTNEGAPPKHISLSNSIEKCCFRFFSASQEECIFKSNNPNHGVTSCHSLKKKRQCRKDNSCNWNETSNTCTTSTISESNACASLKKKPCKRDESCHWNDISLALRFAYGKDRSAPLNEGRCSPNTSTPRPSLNPTHQSLVTNNSMDCKSSKNKRQCKSEESCAWDENVGLCIQAGSTTFRPPTKKPTFIQSTVSSESSSCDFTKKNKCKRDNSCRWVENGVNEGYCRIKTDDTMTPNLSVASCSSGLCTDFDGTCQTKYSCLLDPCLTIKCKGNQLCESNYCGGCNSRCIDSMTVQNASAPKPSPFKPSSNPTSQPITPVSAARPISNAPTKHPTTSPPSKRPSLNPSKPPINQSDSDLTAAVKVMEILEDSKNGIDNNILLYQNPSNEWEPSNVYRYDDFSAALGVMHTDGVANKYFYMGGDSLNGHKYGLVNIAAFLAQSMKETIRYNACDENSWDLVNGVYPVSNACGQLGQSYQDYKCSAAEAHMQCEVDPNMDIRATTNSKWWGAPAPLFCGPKSVYPHTGFWDYTMTCHDPWADPPQHCEDYEGQKAGGFNNDSPTPNSSGRTDVEGCCFWGRGVIQTTGICNFGKLNYYLGARAASEGRDARYPDINFCEHPDAICSSEEHKELKWIAGMFYWVESLQSYNSGGWNYINELQKWVDGGMVGNSFIDSVSGIVNRGCHNPPCAAGAVDGQFERSTNFWKVLSEFGL